MAIKAPLIFGRPRYVIALLAGALIGSAYEVYSLVSVAGADQHRYLLSYPLSGGSAYAVSVLKLAIYVCGGIGLWGMRKWARLLAMGYLAYELAAYVLAGTGGLTALIGVQLLFLPYATFCFMYLQRNAKAFG